MANPAQRVQFLLGEEEDEEHKSHDLFCEMEELFYNGDQIEWKESARFVSPPTKKVENINSTAIISHVHIVHTRLLIPIEVLG